VRNLLREWKVDIVCCQETKLEVMPRSVVHSLWGCHHVDWPCSLFSDFIYFIFYQGLMDLPLVGGSFTWSNKIRILLLDPELIDSLTLGVGIPASFVVYPRGGFFDCVRIISQSSYTLVIFQGVVGPSNLKTCS
jgi:hypothetical protein